MQVCAHANCGDIDKRNARLPSDLRPTIQSLSIYVATHGHFRSREKDSQHTIRSAIAKNPMLLANSSLWLYVL